MSRCYICDFCDETKDEVSSSIEESDKYNYTIKDEKTGEFICNNCSDSIAVSLSTFNFDSSEEEFEIGNLEGWRTNKYFKVRKRSPKERKGPRTGTKRAMYPEVPQGTYDTAKGRIVLEGGEFVVHGSERWKELRERSQ